MPTDQKRRAAELALAYEKYKALRREGKVKGADYTTMEFFSIYERSEACRLDTAPTPHEIDEFLIKVQAFETQMGLAPPRGRAH